VRKPGEQREQRRRDRADGEERKPQQRRGRAIEQRESDEDGNGKQARGAHRRTLVGGELRLVLRQRHREPRFAHAQGQIRCSCRRL
jgi:hypothetical protein